jgi:hypothetical protein
VPDIPALPKLLSVGRLANVQDLGARLYQWVSGADRVLQALRQAILTELLPTDGSLAMTGALWLSGENLELTGAVRAQPFEFELAGGAINLDVSAYSLWVQADRLTQDSTVGLGLGRDGDAGSLLVRQDGTGAWDLVFTIPDRTILRAFGDTDDTPHPGANARTLYTYLFCTLGGTSTVLIRRFLLT